MAKFGVSYYREAPTYGGKPQRRDFGIVDAETADEAKDTVVRMQGELHAKRADGSLFDPRGFRAFLTATALDDMDAKALGPNIALEMEKVIVHMATTLGMDPGVGSMIAQAACVELIISKYIDDAFSRESKLLNRERDEVRRTITQLTCALLSNPSFTIGTSPPGANPIDDLMAHLLRKSSGSHA